MAFKAVVLMQSGEIPGSGGIGEAQPSYVAQAPAALTPCTPPALWSGQINSNRLFRFTNDVRINPSVKQ